MAEKRLCTACSGWFCRSDDAWCGNCGTACAQVDFSLVPDVMQVKNIASRLSFTAVNRSCSDLQIEKLELPSWIKVVETAAHSPGLPSRIPAGGTVQFGAKAATMAISTPEAATIRLRTNAVVVETQAMVIEETPTFSFSPPELELWGSGSKPIEVSIAPQQGALRVRGVRRGPRGEIDVLSSPVQPVLATPRQGCRVVLQVSVERFRQQPAVSLTVEYDGAHGPTQAEVQPPIKLKNPPELRWLGENEPPLKRFAAVGQRLSFVVANGGSDGGSRNGRLTIESVDLQPPPGLEGVPIKLQRDPPITLPGGENTTLEFEAELDKVKLPFNVPLAFRLVIRSPAATLDKPVFVMVRPLPEYDGALAIDFGSSNTCAAVVETGRELESLALDGDEAVSPTILRYISLQGAVPQVETGARVRRLAISDDRFAASTVSRLKQRLGDEDQNIPVRPYDTTEWVLRSATQAVADYLREVRRVVEREKQTIFRDFILTHPAVCSLRQYRNLYQALTGAFGEKNRQVRFLPEPIAALIPFFAERSVSLQAPGYTVASFDLGGGTTDIAAIRVEHALAAAGRMVIRPTILYSRGVRFGGEDLTDFLVSQMEGRIDERLALSKPGAKLIRKGVPGASMEDVLRNQFAMRSTAEQFKASLSSEGKTIDRRAIGLRIQSAANTGSEEHSIGFDELFVGSTGDLKTRFLEYLRSNVRQMATLLADAEQRVGKFDHIQLSGMTSYLPAVSECVQEMFPRSKVVRALSPKQCVVTGACLSMAMGRGSARYLALPGDARTTSSIGLYSVGDRTFTVLLPVDTPIPEQGLTAELENAWFGFQRVVLWENLGVSGEELQKHGSQALSKLGTWQPERPCAVDEATGWTLRLRLKNFTLELHAIGPNGETVAFHCPEQFDGNLGAQHV